jgi:hypothetical protein
MRLFRLTTLCTLIKLIVGVHLLLAQEITDPDEVRSLPAPAADEICTLGHTDIDAHFFVRPEPHVRQRMVLDPEADFQVTFENDCGTNIWPVQAQNAFEHALSIWSVHVQSLIPIRVEATWADIEPLGSAGPTRIIHSSSFIGGESNTWYPIAQASAMSNIDFVTAIDDEDFDITVQINCNVGNWYFGTDASPGGNQLDLATVVLHEVGHGLGFLGTMEANNNTQTAEWGIDRNNQPNPLIYDRFVQDGDDVKVIDESVYPNDSGPLYEAVTGQRGGLFFSGQDTDRMFTGMPVPLYAPSTWVSGSSYSHVDDEPFRQTQDALMRPRIDRAFAIHTPGPVFCGILSDKGWPLGNSCREFLDRDAMIVFEPDRLDFELVNIGNPKELTLMITNDETSEDPIQGRVEIEGDTFSIIQGGGSFDLEPGDELPVVVRFDPVSPGEKSGQLLVFHNAFNETSPINVPLIGEALERDVLARLGQNFPNPFNISTQINYGLPQESDVRIDLFTVTGQLIKTLVNERKPAGDDHYVILEAGNLSSGIYLYRIIVDGFAETNKMMLIR